MVRRSRPACFVGRWIRRRALLTGSCPTTFPVSPVPPVTRPLKFDTEIPFLPMNGTPEQGSRDSWKHHGQREDIIISVFALYIPHL